MFFTSVFEDFEGRGVAVSDNYGERPASVLSRLRDRVRYGWPPLWPIAVSAAVVLFTAHALTLSAPHLMGLLVAGAFALLAAAAVLATPGRGGVSPWILAAAGAYAVGMATPTAHVLFPQFMAGLTGGVDGQSAALRAALWREWVVMAGLGAAFLVGLAMGRQDRRARLMVALLVFGGAGYAAVSLGLHVWALVGEGAGAPFTASFMTPQTAAFAFALTSILAVGGVLHGARQAGSSPFQNSARMGGGVVMIVAMTGALTVSLAALIATGHRWGVAATLFIMALYAAGEWRASVRDGRWGWGWVGLVSVMAGGLALVVGGALVRDKLGATGVDDPWRIAGMAGTSVSNVLADAPLGLSREGAMLTTGAADGPLQFWMARAGLVSSVPVFIGVGILTVLMVGGLARRTPLRSWLRACLAVTGVVVCFASEPGVTAPASLWAHWAVVLGLGAGLATADRMRATAVQLG